MLQLNVRALGGFKEMENNFIDADEGTGKIRVVLGDFEVDMTVNEAMQFSANLITEASVAMGISPVSSKLQYSEEDFLKSVYDAEKKFSESGYVGLSYFVSRWNSDKIPKDKKDRQRMLHDLSKKGLIEIYDAKDAKAIRLEKDKFIEFEVKYGNEDSDEIDSE